MRVKACFSDNGYPAGSICNSQPADYGTATDQMQRDVPRAYLRSASHEVGHVFNQRHPEDDVPTYDEDNSIMSPTPVLLKYWGVLLLGHQEYSQMTYF